MKDRGKNEMNKKRGEKKKDRQERGGCKTWGNIKERKNGESRK